MNLHLVLIILFKLYIINVICIHTKSISVRETSELSKGLTNYNRELNNENNERINKRETGLGLDVVKHIAIENLEKFQPKQNGSVCIPGSLSYNGSCLFFSSDKQKLSWRSSERFCRKLPFNTSYLVIKNDHQINTIKTELLKLRNKENPSDQLVFYIGFSFTSNEWKWVNNQSLRNTNLTLGRYFWDWTGSHGDCGSIALLKNNELVMRSAPCQSTKGRFICEYTLDPCHENNMCGKYGKCVNLYYKPYCDCSVTIFYEGKYCEKLNWAAVQTIVALVIIIVLFISIFCQTSFFTSIWNEFFGKEPNKNDSKDKNQPHTNKKDTNQFDDESVPVNRSSSKIKSPEKIFQGISGKIRNFGLNLVQEARDLNKKEITAYSLLIGCTFLLTFVQVSIIHNFFETTILKEFKKRQEVRDMCNRFENNYLVEELVYLIPALLFFIVLWYYHRTRRFNKYIMLKFKHYFKTDCYKNLLKKQREQNEYILKKKKEEISKRKCGWCQLKLFSCLRNNFCRVFCCLCCCSCCVPPGSNYRCFLCYCCVLGWQQTDCAKVYRAVKKVFYYLFLCCIWKPLWQMYKRRRDEKKFLRKKEEKEKKRRESQAHGLDPDLFDIDAEVDEDDFDPSQEFKRTTFPFPSMPFSTSNRAQSASVYVIYTYDVLNIFVYIYTATVTNIDIPYFGRPSGILFDLLIQVLHVLLIGIKFYPILIVADMDPYGFVYFCASVYMTIIWVFKLFTKGFCSRTEAFVKQTLKKLSNEYGAQIKGKIQNRYNITNTVFGLFSDRADPAREYLSNIKNVLPKVFIEFFGKYDQSSSLSSFDFGSLNDDYPLSPDRYYGTDLTQSIEFFTTTAVSTTSTTSYGFRDRLKNKTISKAKSFMEILSERNETSDKIINILENLPLYLTLSFLLSRYLILFLGCIVDGVGDFCKPKKRKTENNSDESPKSVETVEDILKALDYKSENHFTSQMQARKNHNYHYIQELLQECNFFGNYSGYQRTGTRRTKSISFFLNLWHTYIYENVPYMKYSKQFVNTYTVAFMVIYFFTLFGFRLSNLFGNSIIVTFELIYRFIFRGMIPSFNFDDHNFNFEFRMTCLFTSLVVAWQLFRSIRNFHDDLKKLHKGEKFFSAYVKKYTDKNLILKSAEERRKASSTITADSLHFPGYLIAHLVYGYALLFMIFFCFTMFIKLLSYFPKLFQISSQVLLPLIILVSLKLIVVKYATRIIFLREDGQRITNLAPYYTLTYFNFFFDCFLGFVACASRIWQTTVMSVLTLPRLDKSMFNRDNELIIRRLDKGHVAYINYIRMEHWYNNPVVNGFCEMLIESMFYSQIYKIEFEDKAKNQVEKISSLDGQNHLIVTREISRTKNQTKQLVKKVVFESPIEKDLKTFEDPEEHIDSIIHIRSDSIQVNPSFQRQMSQKIKGSNPDFNYASFLRLRNLFYLCLLLKANPSLRKFRHHYLANLSKKEFQKNFQEVEGLSETIKNKVFKRINTIKNLFRGSKSNLPSPSAANLAAGKSESKAIIIKNPEENSEINLVASNNSSGSDLAQNTINFAPRNGARLRRHSE